MNWLNHSLSTKVTLLSVAILIAGFGVLVILNIRQEVQDRIEKHGQTARVLATSMMTSIENGMLEGRPDIIRRLVQELKTELKDVQVLEVYRRNGVEAFSDLETVKELEFAGYLQPDLVERISKMRRQPGLKITHPLFARAVQTAQSQETEETVDGTRVLTLFQPLRNLKECHDCHGSEDTVRGVLRISLGLQDLEAELKRARDRQLSIALITILGVALTLVAFMGRVVLRPLAHVASVARQIGGGAFHARVNVKSKDEMGQLGTAINDMSSRLKQAYEDLETKNKTLDETLQSLRDSMKRVELLEQLKGELSKFVPESVKHLLEKNPDATELEKRERDVSVLFLDIAGYTRLSEQMDPKQLNRLVQSYFSAFLNIIRGHGGDVNETAGDGLMVVFQSERPEMEHALNAARSALAIQRQVEELNEQFAGVFQPVFLHMGINSGVALVGATKFSAGADARWTFTASGPVTNIAARIAGQAAAGEVLVSATTADRIKSHLVLENIGERSLKNVAEPVQLYRVISPGLYARVEREG
ncbi:MAG TPA: adenylate/guanylate cyclase domain-containing protein [Candidatus Binatia bacterium]|nr:adenylate/guanylate cyclase domain-containing protein [Candidatus Binatia bacterium]